MEESMELVIPPDVMELAPTTLLLMFIFASEFGWASFAFLTIGLTVGLVLGILGCFCLQK
jgi:hypothetical protein